MKILKLSPFFLLTLFLSLSSIVEAQPQQPIQIIDAADSTWYTPCPAPQTIEMYMYGIAPAYNIQDLITIEVHFGDGSDTVFTTPVGQFQSNFNAWFTHAYQYAGQYTVQYIAIAPDGESDTLVVPNEVFIGDTCGNVSGMVYIDENSNCQFDQGEAPLAHVPVSISAGGSMLAWYYTDPNGNYYFDVPVGQQYEIHFDGNNNYGFTSTCPPSGTISVSSVPSSGNDFGVACEAGYDLTGYVTGWGFRPAFDANIYFCPKNLHCLPTSGQAMLVLDDPLLTFLGANPAPDDISGDTLVWNFNDLTNAYSYGNCISLHVHTDTFAQIGDEVCVDMIITPNSGDQDPSNNMETYCFPIQNSWDPNDKAVTPAGEGTNGAILNNMEMAYRVRFQNTGTAPAVNIFILDTLDDNLDVNTLKVLSASHPMTTSILEGNILKFNFPDIWLADSVSNEPESHGFVSYRITQKTDLPHGTEIENTAHIYFDFNPAVVTNTVLSTIDLSLSVEENGATVPVNVSIWPNPAQDLINIKFDRSLSGAGIQLLDMTGRVVESLSVNGLQMQIETVDLAAGAYTLVLNTKDNELVRKKIILVK